MEEIEIKNEEIVAQAPKKRKRIRYVYSKDRYSKSKCNLCGKRLSAKALAYHHQSVHGNDVYQCTICDKGFTRAANVKQHIRKLHHGMDLDWYTKIKREDLPIDVLKDMQSRARAAVNSIRNPPPSTVNITKFNCYDCNDSFPSVKELFTHCETHRVSETGKKFPYLVKTEKRWSSVHNRWVYK